MELRADDEAATDRLGRALARALRAGDVLILEGGLGAGKTTFVRSVARGLGLPEDEPVTSPSFAVVQEYETEPPLVHADLYRLGHPDELLQLGLEELVGAEAIACIEWGLGFVDALPRVDLVLSFAGAGDEARTIHLDVRSPRGDALASALASISAI